METSSNRLLVFAVVGVLLFTLVVFTLWIVSARNPDGRDYLIRFDQSVAGINKGSSVTYSGVPAGSVTSIRLDAQEPSMVLVTVRLDRNIPVLQGVKASISRSFFSGDATVTLDGATKGAPPIVQAAGQDLPEIPSKKGGLLGSGGDPMALVAKISRTVDDVSRNLDPKGQERLSRRLAAFAAGSAVWPRRAARVTDRLTGLDGRVARFGDAAAGAGLGADRLRKRLASGREKGFAGLNDRLVGARRGIEKFGDNVAAARPKIRAFDDRRRAITDRIRSVRSTTRDLQEKAEDIDRGGVRLGAPRLPDYRPRANPVTPPSVQQPNR
ncbi:MlaD family protein [Stakelama marina]|uniref:MCE family protein n=1 Tax=Stakelama marina TaxID=2826939 RepID=A0A8T4II54_9SPHN|nr:MlaD family protein [Stakelama marina]MBR0553722.1 MCE family protein [Stakelama marina]